MGNKDLTWRGLFYDWMTTVLEIIKYGGSFERVSGLCVYVLWVCMVNSEFLQAIQEKYVNTHLSEECWVFSPAP